MDKVKGTVNVISRDPPYNDGTMIHKGTLDTII